MVRYRIGMAVKDPIKNRAYVAKSRAKLISRIGIEAYRKKMAEAQSPQPREHIEPEKKH